MSASKQETYTRFGVCMLGVALFSFSDSADGRQFTLTRNSTTHFLEARRGNATGTIMATGTHAIDDSIWYCIEVHLKVAESPDGVCQVKIDGVTDIDFSGDTAATANLNIQYTYWGGCSDAAGINGWMDDIALNDTSGAVNNSWIGRGGIYKVVPTGAGTYTDLTPSAGSNWQCVDEVPPSDTDYVYDSTVDHKDSYAANDLTGSGTVNAVKWIGRAKAVAAGAYAVARFVRVSGSDYTGTDVPVDASWKHIEELFDVDPSGAAWSVAKVNGMEPGIVIR